MPLLQAQSQLQGLSRLQQRLAGARGGDLVTLRAEIAASVAATQLLVQQSRVAAATQTAEAVLSEARQALRDEVTSLAEDFYEKKKFDPYLRFASAEDEAAYRKREGERQRQIEEELAKGTPQGELAAAKIMREQLDDAGAHGADASPDLQRARDRLSKVEAPLAAALAKEPAAKDAPASTKSDDVTAALVGAGVSLAATSAEGHGLADNARPSAKRSV